MKKKELLKVIEKLRHDIELLQADNKDLSGVIEVLKEDKKALNTLVNFQNNKIEEYLK